MVPLHDRKLFCEPDRRLRSYASEVGELHAMTMADAILDGELERFVQEAISPSRRRWVLGEVGRNFNCP